MVAASIILSVLTVIALAYFAWRLERGLDEMLVSIHDTVEEEVRRQDDRLEKRRQREVGREEDSDGTEPDTDIPRIVAGRPTRA